MSADNWTKCPRCQKAAQDAMDAKEEKLLRQIDEIRTWGTDGSTDMSDAIELLEQKREQLEPEDIERTFREDYEFWGADEGIVGMVYKGSCKECGLSTKYEHEYTFFPEPTT